MAASELEARRAALKASRLFQCLQPAELDAVLAHAITKRFPRGSIILRKADPGTGMIVVLSGRVQIGATSGEGKEITLAILGQGELLGELSLIDGQSRSADAIALEECVVLRVERAHFLRLLQGNPDLCLRLMTVLCERLRRVNAALEDIALLDLPGRLGRLLVRLSGEYRHQRSWRHPNRSQALAKGSKHACGRIERTGQQTASAMGARKHHFTGQGSADSP